MGRLGGVITAVVAVTLASAGAASAGVTIPNPGDRVLGSAGGLTYRADSERFGGPTGSGNFAFALVGCGPQSRHVLGGGVRAEGAGMARKVVSTLPRDNTGTEPDSLPDDGWEAGGQGPDQKRLTAFAICTTLPLSRLRYVRDEPPNTGEQARFGEASCGGGRWHATGGGGIASPSDAYLSSSQPLDSSDANSQPDDEWLLAFFDPFAGIGGSDVEVICRRGPGLAYREASRHGIGTGKVGSRKVRCPKGSHVVGGGAHVSGSVLDGRFIDSHPIDLPSDADRVPDDGWRAKSVNEGGSATRLTVRAICLR
jgi:hypothetical protein